MRRVSIIIFGLRVVKKSMQNFLIVKHFMIVSFLKYINRSQLCFVKHNLKEPACKWACIINFKQLCLEQSHKAPFKKDLMRNILQYPILQYFYNILSVLYILIIFIIYQAIHSFSKKI